MRVESLERKIMRGMNESRSVRPEKLQGICIVRVKVGSQRRERSGRRTFETGVNFCTE